MRFMMLVKGNSDYEAGRPPSPKLMAKLHEMGEQATQSGKMVMSGGLAPSAQSTLVRLEGGRKRFIDGPFAEAKELVGGFAIFEVESKEEALKLAHEFVDAHSAAGVTEFEMEIRPMFGPPG